MDSKNEIQNPVFTVLKMEINIRLMMHLSQCYGHIFLQTQIKYT